MAIDPHVLSPRTGQNSRLLSYLPAVFQEQPGAATGSPLFLGRLLMAFEAILLGLNKSTPQESGELSQVVGLEEILGGAVDSLTGKKLLEGVQRFFEPGAGLADSERVPTDFLPWLAGWVSLTLREDWDESRKRDFIARAVQLYRTRGTSSGVASFVEVYTGLPVEIDEANEAFQIGVHSSVGVDTVLLGGEPFFFRVKLRLPNPDPVLFKQQTDIATSIIELQKPAHTSFSLEVETPQFRIGLQSTVGVDTLLGTSTSS
ncbi:MAG TPA: phage tail protein [Candidatus Eisenbacteria bacterium]|nr:phage tail protein [Candidatus Eisenbacteria bacterium]